MILPFVRVDVSDAASDFRPTAFEPGLAMLDSSNATAKIVHRWLGRFPAEPEWQGNLVDFHVCDEQGRRLSDARCRLAIAGRLDPALNAEIQDLRTRIARIRPVNAAERSIAKSLSDAFDAQILGLQRGNSDGFFFVYRDFRGTRRLVWCWGYHHAHRDAQHAAICRTPGCRSLFLRTAARRTKCLRCLSPSAARQNRRALWVGGILVVLLLLLLGAGLYWFTRPAAVLAGVVVNANNLQPIPGAEIFVAGTNAHVRSEKDGRFRLDRLPAGPITMVVSASGFRTERFDKDLPPHVETAIRVPLSGDATLVVEVANSATNEPIADAQVRILGTTLANRTDAAGRTQFAGLCVGPAMIEVLSPHFVTKRLERTLTNGEKAQLHVTLNGDAVLVGHVVQRATHAPIQNAQVSIVGTRLTTSTAPDGSFRLANACRGMTTVEVSARAYPTVRMQEELVSSGDNEVQIMLAGVATLTGEVVNGMNNRPIGNAKIAVVGTNLLATTAPDGRFRVPGIPTGRVSLEVSAAGFRADRYEEHLVSGSEKPFRAVLSPELKAGEIRIILTWGETPSDLDSHLYGPLPGGQHFHVYFSHRVAPLVNLDVDDTDGFGPETITIRKTIVGRYTYVVHNFTNRNAPASLGLARSQAEVRVYIADRVHRYRVDTASPGVAWHAFDLEVTEEHVSLRPISQYAKHLPDE